MYPFWDLAIQPVLEAVGATPHRRDRRAAGRHHGPDARRARRRRRAPRHRPASGVRPGGARAALSRAGTSSTATSASTCSTGSRRWTPRSSTVTTTGTPSTTSCKRCARTARAAGEPLPVLHPARRRLALRPPRPLLRARADPGGVPPAVPPGRHDARAAASSPSQGGLNPHNCNADHEGGPRNGVMTGARRLHGRARPTAPPRGAAGLLRAGDRRRGGGPRRAPRAAGGPRRLEGAEGRGPSPSSPRQLRLEGLTEYHNVWYGPLHAPRRCGRRLPRAPQGRAAQRALHRAGAAHPPAGAEHRARYAPFGESLRDPTRRLIAQFDDSARSDDPAGRPDTDGRRRRRTSRSPRWVGCGSTPSRRALDTVRLEGVPGDLVECGTGRGGGGVFMRGYLAGVRHAVAPGLRRRPLPGAPPRARRHHRPTTTGVPGRRRRVPRAARRTSTSVRDAFARFDLLDDRVRFLQGPYDGHASATPTRPDRAAAHRRRPSATRPARSSTRSTTR